ncbi:MAG: hypothetical protein JWN04_5560 [Myxococcaceae bacterium]|nr:hypothetical protein [Myxococcaceae bacterium]
MGEPESSGHTKEAFRQKAGDEPVAVVVAGKLYYMNAAGRAAPVLLFGNGPDYFVEGLARTVRNSKVGFIDTALIERIAPRWDFAFPFEQGVAIVCQGCRAQPMVSTA